ncbi:DBH-like monooxygenase protein 1 homolog [Lampetra fluviatilis]
MSVKMMAPAVVMMVMMITGVMKVSCALNVTGNLPFSVVLASGNFNVSWAFDKEQIVLEAQVRTLGWIGLGLSSTGRMAGSDVVVGWVDSAAATHLVDAHIEGVRNLVPDASQDYKLVRLSQNDTHTVMRVVRALRTCDVNDRDITEDTVRLLWAYSAVDPANETQIMQHGAATRGSKSVQLLSSGSPMEQPLPQNYSTFDVVNDKFIIPTLATYYSCKLFQLPKLDKKHHLIKVKPVIQAGNERYVHHLLVYVCLNTLNVSYVGSQAECYKFNSTHPFATCKTVMAAWAVGGETFDYPANAGFSLGLDEDPQFLLLQMHYDNAGLVSGVSDSSGFRFYYTPELRTYDAGLLETGIFAYWQHFVPPNTARFTSYGICNTKTFYTSNANSTLQGQVNGTINVFATFLHTHLAGISVQARHFRNGTQIGNLGRDMGYDFDFQETRYLNKLTSVLPGDQIITECIYNTTGRNTTTAGGLGTMDEMCLSFFYYYPKVNVGICRSVYNVTTIGLLLGYNVSTKFPYNILNPAYNGQTINSIYDSVNWTEQLIRTVERTAYTTPQEITIIDSIFYDQIPEIPVDPTTAPCIATTTTTAATATTKATTLKGSAPGMNAAITTILLVILLHLMGTALRVV